MVPGKPHADHAARPDFESESEPESGSASLPASLHHPASLPPSSHLPPHRLTFGGSILLLIRSNASTILYQRSSLQPNQTNSCSTPTTTLMAETDHVPPCSAHKYHLTSLSISSSSPRIYPFPTLSHSFNTFDEHSQEEQIRSSWDARHDPITTFFIWSLLESSPAFKKADDKGPADSSSEG